jgi:hypothetical protein
MVGLPDEPSSINGSKCLSHFSSKYVGTFLKLYHTKVHWRDTMNYAAAAVWLCLVRKYNCRCLIATATTRAVVCILMFLISAHPRIEGGQICFLFENEQFFR